MQRWTARLLLLFALVGTFVPLALASAPAPPRACCLRMAHHCHDSAAADSTQPTVRTPGCCNHDCCRAVTTSQWAHPQQRMTAIFAQNIDPHVGDLHPNAPAADLSSSQSTRAPPHSSVA